MRHKIGIIGFGILGRALAHGFVLHADIKIYDKHRDYYNSLDDTVNMSDFIFVNVPTPMKEDGKQDISAVSECVRTIDKVSNASKIIIIRSTILPGTTRTFAENYTHHNFIFCPEFLTARSSFLDFINTARIILGGEPDVTNEVEKLFRCRFEHTPIYKTTWETAELVKYMANCFFSVKISFLNEMYDICQYLGISFEDAKKMWMADGRIGNSHTDVPGHDGLRGYGGMCVKPESTLLTDINRYISIKTLYHKYTRHHVLPKVQSYNSDFTKINYKNIKKVTRRFVDNEKLLVFKTDYGTFTCTKEHLLPVYRNGKIILIQAKDILITDEFISPHTEIFCNQGCGRIAKFVLSRKPWCVDKSSKCPVMKRKNSNSVKQAMSTDEYRENDKK